MGWTPSADSRWLSDFSDITISSCQASTDTHVSGFDSDSPYFQMSSEATLLVLPTAHFSLPVQQINSWYIIRFSARVEQVSIWNYFGKLHKTVLFICSKWYNYIRPQSARLKEWGADARAWSLRWWAYLLTVSHLSWYVSTEFAYKSRRAVQDCPTNMHRKYLSALLLLLAQGLTVSARACASWSMYFHALD